VDALDAREPAMWADEADEGIDGAEERADADAGGGDDRGASPLALAAAFDDADAVPDDAAADIGFAADVVRLTALTGSAFGVSLGMPSANAEAWCTLSVFFEEAALATGRFAGRRGVVALAME
jgi:hypothetical protein